jgi:predicted adenylyl cyclase CyaB
MKFRQLTTVDKVRKAFSYKNWEVALDSIKNLGEFVEIEYKGSDKVDPKKETNKMVAFLKNTGCGKIERNYLGYPFQLLFPNEVKWEAV